eukprot:scaffold133663_cov17-Tisochrysis_lutea.AAC.1
MRMVSSKHAQPQTELVRRLHTESSAATVALLLAACLSAGNLQIEAPADPCLGTKGYLHKNCPYLVFLKISSIAELQHAYGPFHVVVVAAGAAVGALADAQLQSLPLRLSQETVMIKVGLTVVSHKSQ